MTPPPGGSTTAIAKHRTSDGNDAYTAPVPEGGVPILVVGRSLCTDGSRLSRGYKLADPT